MGYYPGYQQSDLPPADVRFDLMSHVAVGAVLPKSDGSLDIAFYQTPQTGPAFAKDLADRAHKAGRKAVLMVGGAGAHDGFAAAASKPGTRSTLVANLVDFAKAHSFDGFDLDWEPLPEPELDDFAALAAGLRAAWPEAVITVPLGGINVNFETVSVKWATISSSLDQVNLMTYSMAGAYQGWESWHHSPLDGETPNTPTSISSSVDAFLAAGVPAAKLGIGAGFYGLCYTSPVNGPNQDLGAANAIGDDNQLAYRTLMSTYFTAAANKWDAAASSAYLTFQSPKGPLGCTYISYLEEQGIKAQTDYVKQKGLGGFIVWTINEGHLSTGAMDARDPLLAALSNGLKLGGDAPVRAQALRRPMMSSTANSLVISAQDAGSCFPVAHADTRNRNTTRSTLLVWPNLSPRSPGCLNTTSMPGIGMGSLISTLDSVRR